jgi:hypothetical protein
MAGEAALAGIKAGSLWRDSVVSDLDVDFGGTGFHARWKYHRCDCGDIRVMVEQIAPDAIITGELLIVDGVVMLARGFDEQDADIEPLIQAPSLMLQLAFSLLDRVQPDGPFAVEGKQAWNEEETQHDFKLDTGLATGMFATPWRVKGSGWKTATGSRRFELFFEFSTGEPGVADHTESITLSGDLDYLDEPFPYPETTVLDGWRVQWISLNETESVVISDGLTLQDLRQKAGGL